MMATQETHKYCKECDSLKEITDFYRAGAYYQCLCKPCHNGKRHTPKAKKHPFDKYPEDVKQILIQYFPKRKEDKLVITMSKLSDMTGIKRGTLQSWRKKYSTL
jgi:hypothetical protein